MRLTDRIIEDSIKSQFSILESRNLGTVTGLRNALIFTPGEELEKHYIYIVRDSKNLFDIKRIPKEILLIIFGDIPDWMLSGSSCIVLNAQEDVSAVLNCIVRTFQRMEVWEEQMEQVLKGTGNIDDLLKIANRYLGNPVAIFREDTSLISVAYEGEKPEYFKNREDKMENMKQVNSLLQDENYRELLKTDQVYWGLEYIGGTASLNWNIKKNGETTFVLSVLACNKPLKEAEGDILMLMGGYVKSFLFSRGGYSGHRDDALHKILTKIISERDADYMEASWELENLGWQRNQEYICIVFESAFIDQGSAPITQICNYMEGQIRGCSSFAFKNKVVNFINLSITNRSIEELSSDLVPFIRDSFLKAGYSRAMVGHMNLRRQYLQGRIALDVGTRKRPYIWVHFFNTIAQDYIMEQICRTMPASMLCHEKLLLLKKHDEEHNTEYMESLKSYLDNQQNAVQTARSLSIHRSTFLYRLEKMKEILEVDLEDPDEVLYLTLSFRLLEQDMASDNTI